MAKYTKKIEDIDECPSCGSDFGYYQKHFVSGPIQMMKDFNGKPNCSETYDHLRWTRASKFYYCTQCHERLARVGN